MSDFDFTSMSPEDATRAFIAESPMPDAEPPREEHDKPDGRFIEAPAQTPRSKQYERKTRKVLNKGMRWAFDNPATVPDGAALIMYGPSVSRAVGDLADKSSTARGVVDFITDGSDNPYAALASSGVALLAQMVRNHEPILEPAVRGFKLPFMKGRIIRFRFGIKLGRVRMITNDPELLCKHVFSDPDVMQELLKAKIRVAGMVYPE